jgi:hypothetical protein
VRYGGAPAKLCARAALGSALRTWWVSPGDGAAVAVEGAGGSVVWQVHGPQHAGGALGDRTPAGAAHVGGDPAGAASSWGFPEASVASARLRIAMSAAGTRPIILTSMALLTVRESPGAGRRPPNVEVPLAAQ